MPMPLLTLPRLFSIQLAPADGSHLSMLSDRGMNDITVPPQPSSHLTTRTRAVKRLALGSELTGGG